MMKKIGTSITLMLSGYLCLLVFWCCEKQSCGGSYSDGVKSVKVELKRIVDVKREKYTQQLVVDSYMPDSNGIRYDSVGIDVHNSRVAMNRKDFGLANVYACDPAVSSDIIREVIITSSEDYSPEFPKGANLGDIMLVWSGSYMNSQEIKQYIHRDLAYPGNNFYTLQSPPSEDKWHDITIKYILTDGRVIQTVSEGVLIKK